MSQWTIATRRYPVKSSVFSPSCAQPESATRNIVDLFNSHARNHIENDTLTFAISRPLMFRLAQAHGIDIANSSPVVFIDSQTRRRKLWLLARKDKSVYFRRRNIYRALH